jgi:hypothetical protein
MNTNPNSSPRISTTKTAPGDASLEPTGELAASIRDFRSAMHHVADRESSRPMASGWLAAAKRRHRNAQRRVVLAWTCAALICVGIVPLTTRSHQGPQPVQPTTVASTSSTDTIDDALLEDVDGAISESVPKSLAPLTELDSWNTTASTMKSSPSKLEKK